MDLINDKQFQELERSFKFLARARGEGIDALPCVIFDVETTGLEPTQHELTEIGALKIKGKELQDIFSTLVKPKLPISLEITRLTGIDNEMVKDAPSIKDALPKFLDFIGSSILVAHNADFDVSFIKHNAKQALQKEIANEAVCTVKLARYLMPGLPNHKLHTVAAHFGLPVANRHRAMGDAELTFQVWVHLLDLLKGKGVMTKRDLDSLISRL